MTTRTTTKGTTSSTSGRDLSAEIGFLTRALKAPTMREAVTRIGRAGPRRVLDS